MLGHVEHQLLTRRFGLWLLALTVLASCALFASSAWAQAFPELTGRVVDTANIIPADQKARLEEKLTALETQSQRQVVVVTLADLQGYDIADYGYQLGRKWGIGDKERNDGALLIIAPNERKVRIEVGYGLEPVLTDGLSSLIIQQQIIPRFKAGDMPGGIEAGADAIIQQLSLPPEEAQKVAAAAKPSKQKEPKWFPGVFFLLFFFLIFILPAIRRARGSKSYHSDGVGQIILWSVLDGLSRGSSGGGSGGGSDWGGGGFSGGGGGFGGGGFGGGGSSGGW